MDKLKISVLYCEDEVLVMRSISKLIERKVEKLFTAVDGEEGFKLFMEHKPDIVITDIRMPKLNGLDMIEKMKITSPRSKFVIVSAYGQSDYFQRAIDMGVNGFLLKPLNKDKLYHMIDEFADSVLLKEQIADEKYVRKQTEQELVNVNRMLRVVNECNEALVRIQDKQVLLNRICDIIVDIGGYPFAWIGKVHHNESKSIENVAQSGFDASSLKEMDLSWDMENGPDSPISSAINKKRIVVFNKLKKSQPFFPCIKEQSATIQFSSLVAIPILFNSSIYGALTIYSSEKDAFDESEQKLLQELADDLAYGLKHLKLEEKQEQSMIDLQKSNENLEKLLQQIVDSLTSLVEIRDPYTSGHQKRVALIAEKIAQKFNLPEDQIKGLYIAGLVHDIGKIYVPAEILSKPGRLTEPEFSIIKSHPQAGYDILKKVEFPWPVSTIVVQHHEREDGSGYPNGVKGKEILLEAKILAVSDVVEAMSSHRPYRAARGIDEAILEIKKNSGKLYDKKIVDVCVELFEKDHFSLPKTQL
ncbi:MAG: response regulator [Candidatus Cloacimonetes bacterium]|nr:response regulator [Candidatus Cloacimonadota bacterium]